MKALRQKVKLTNLYYYWMEEFWQLEDGACLYEGQTFDLLQEEQKKSSQRMGTI
jgi:hypothetical protein